MVDWINDARGTCASFDFTTKGILQQAVQGELWRLRDQNNFPPGLIGWMPEKAVTFLDNHDTGSTQNHWPFPADKVMQGYAYILTHPGIPSIVSAAFSFAGMLSDAFIIQNTRSVVMVDCTWNLHTFPPQ
jgi:alpha-amylase